jgi:hypothetical protein
VGLRFDGRDFTIAVGEVAPKKPSLPLGRQYREAVPMSYRVLAEHGLSVTVVAGRVDADDFRDLARRQQSDADWHATTRMLTDNRAALVDDVSANAIEKFSALYDQMRTGDPPVRDAIVAADHFDVSTRFTEHRSRSTQTSVVFGDLAIACAWLGVDEPLVRATITSLRADARPSSSAP